MPSILHRNLAERESLEPTNCRGHCRRLFVRPGSRRYTVPVGYLCDGCGVVLLDDDGEIERRVARVLSYGS